MATTRFTSTTPSQADYRGRRRRRRLLRHQRLAGKFADAHRWRRGRVLSIDDRGIAANIDENVFTRRHVTRIRYPDQINPGAIVHREPRGHRVVDFYLPNRQNYTTIYGAPPDITPGFAASIHGNTSNDIFVLVPRDSNDNLTLYSNLTLVGDGDSDSVTIADNRTLPVNYGFANPFGATIAHISGMGGMLGITNTIENLTINAGGGGDTFNLNSYDSGTALAINGGAGNDTVNWTPLGNNLAEISSMASFNYSGGADSDSMYVYNGSSPTGFDHYVSPGVLSTIRHSDAKQWVMLYANLEQVTVFATQLSDAFQIFYTSPGVAHALYGQGGTNSYSVGGIFPTTLQGVNSPVQIFGSGGTDNIILRNDEDNLARTYHVSQNTVGAAPVDNLFGPGGYVGFHAVVGTLTINNGNGADTIYAQPNISAALAFHGSNPTATPGDTLNLVFAEALNPVFASGGTGAGGYTFSNRAPLNYTGIETGPTIDPGPALLGSYNNDPEVDAADYVLWRKTLGQFVGMYRGADGSGNGVIDQDDFDVWRAHFGETVLGSGSGAVAAPSLTMQSATAPQVMSTTTGTAEPAESHVVFLTPASTGQNGFGEPVLAGLASATITEHLARSGVDVLEIVPTGMAPTSAGPANTATTRSSGATSALSAMPRAGSSN